MPMKTTRLLLLFMFALVATTAKPSLSQTQRPFKEIYTKIEYEIPMRDGVRLYASVYVPRNKPGKHPIMLERTPYGAGPYGVDSYRSGVRGSRQFVDQGYIFAYEDVRGLGKSEGAFVNDRPLLINALKPDDVDESTDTYDTIDFLVKKVPDNNARVGLWGISYPGFYAGIGAVNSHPALKAASPQAPVSDWFVGDDFHHNGALFLMDAVGFARFGETPSRDRQSPFPELSTQDPYHFYLEHPTLSDLTATYFKDTNGLWRYVMEHGTYDEYWQSRSLPAHMKNVHCAVMTVGGWFDAEDGWGALHTYRGTEALNKGIVNTLVMGPWYHGMWAGAKGDGFGDMDWGQPTSTYFQDRIEFPFFDACLRGSGKPQMAEATVFETGANRWRTFAQWPPKERVETRLYLESNKALGPAPPQANSGPTFDTYVSDPASPVPYQGGKIEHRTREYMIDDQRFAARRADVLTYETPFLTKDLEVAGPITADLFVETTGTDADFIVKVIDVYPDDASGKLAGYQMLVRAEVMRAKFRKSYSNPSPLTPGKVDEVRYELPDIFHDFRAGHRLMVQIQSSWFPLVDRNPQVFEDIYTARPEDFRPSTIHIYRSRQFPTHLSFGAL